MHDMNDVAPARPPGPDPLLGRTINGRYRIDAVIARGGMGKVYRAEQAPLGRVCAIKILSPRFDGEDDPDFRRRFFLEASTAAKLTHANTVTIFDYGKSEEEELYYIAMEYIEGRTLSAILQETGPFPEERVRHVAAQICRSLREAHGLGVVHRDLKPGNIMLFDKGDERDNVKVLDFGLVKDVTNDAQDHTQEGVFMGSPKYMAPEQIIGLPLTPRVDIYSLGIMLYEMLTGRVPFNRGGANIATLMAHVNEPLPSMHSMSPNLVISPHMEAIVHRCLEKDPARRFASMSALLLSIKGLAEDGSIDTSGPYPMPGISFLSPDQAPGMQGMHGMPGMPMERPRIPRAPISEKTVVVRRPEGGRKTKLMITFGVLAAALFAGGVTLAMHFAPGSAAPRVSATPGSGSAVKSKDDRKVTVAPSSVANSEPAAITARVIHVESDPAGASVMEESEELCASTPCDVILTGESAMRDHRFTMTKKGYKPKPLAIDPQAASISVTLAAAGGSGAGGSGTPPAARKKPDSSKSDPNFKPDPYKPDPY